MMDAPMLAVMEVDVLQQLHSSSPMSDAALDMMYCTK